MSLLVVGVNQRSGPLDLLERLSVPADELAKAAGSVARRDHVREAVVLSTCNRTEIYAVAERFHGAYDDICDFLCELGDIELHDLSPSLFSQHDAGAVTHLFEVASGLDSAVLGESEILGQVRSAWATARDESASRSSLDLLFRTALRTGKRARSETSIGRGTASVSHAAVEMLTDTLGPLDGRRVLVVGAGSMGEGVAVAVHKAGRADVTVVNRSTERAAALAERIGAAAVGFESLGACVADADVIVAGTGSGRPVITEELVRSARSGSDQPLHVIDIGMPRDVETAVSLLDQVTVRDLDDLRDWADRGRDARRLEAELVRGIVREEVENFELEAAARQAAPLVASMHTAAEAVRRTEVERFAGRLDGLDDSQRSDVEQLTRAIVAKLLHEPSVRLKSQAGTPQGERNAAAVRDLFDLR
ncbi:MAG: glutamyl-tRNA reductase [Actinomycetota bacterium]